MIRQYPYYNATIKNLAYRLRSVTDNLPSYIETAVMANSDVIIDTIRYAQLYRRGISGEPPDGRKIKEYEPYKPSTIARKKRKKQPYTRVTLKDTGEFYKSMYIVTDDKGFYVTSDDEKTKYLVSKYGKEIFRFTDKNLTRIVRVHLRKTVQKLIKKGL